MPKWLRSNRLGVCLIWLLILAGWEAAYREIGWRPWIFPAPSHLMSSTANMMGVPLHLGDPVTPNWPWRPAKKDDVPVTLSSLAKSPLAVAVATSWGRLAVGFSLSIIIGTFLGLAMWRYRFIDDMLGALLLGLQTLPSVCWVPVSIMVFGITEAGMLFVLLMGSFPAVATSLRDGMNATPPIYQSVGKVFGARGLSFYIYVMLPASLPVMIGSLRTGFSFAWRSLMGGELIFVMARHGLGHLLSTGREFGDLSQVIAVIIIMVLLGMLLDPVVFGRIDKRIRARYGLEGAN